MTGILKVDELQKNDGSAFPIGKVLQVIHDYMPVQVEGAMSSWTSLGLSASITPSSTSSKILIIVQMAGCGTRDTGTTGRLALYRDSNIINFFADYIGSNIGSGVENYPGTIWLDSPNTTSAVNYNVQAIRANGSANVYINHYRGGSTDSPTNYAVSTMTVMEIAG